MILRCEWSMVHWPPLLLERIQFMFNNITKMNIVGLILLEYFSLSHLSQLHIMRLQLHFIDRATNAKWRARILLIILIQRSNFYNTATTTYMAIGRGNRILNSYSLGAVRSTTVERIKSICCRSEMTAINPSYWLIV